MAINTLKAKVRLWRMSYTCTLKAGLNYYFSVGYFSFNGEDMLRLLFLLPLTLCLLWYAYLRANNWTISQGKQGFLYIFAFSSTIAAFFALMLFLTKT